MPNILTAMEIRDALVPILQSHNITEAKLFGSYAKGCATPYSDVDVYVVSNLGGLQYFGFRGEMIDALGKDVDLLSSQFVALDSELSTSITETGIDIFQLTSAHLTSNGVTRDVMKKHDTKYLKDLLMRCSRIENIIEKVFTLEELASSRDLPEAAAYNLGIIEMIAQVFLSPSAKEELPDIPWVELERLEKSIMLPMCEIDCEAIWRISHAIIPAVQKALQEYLKV